MIIRVDTGLANSYLLSIEFRYGHLYAARIRGEDGPHESFPDAPADLGPTI